MTTNDDAPVPALDDVGENADSLVGDEVAPEHELSEELLLEESEAGNG